MKTAAIFLTIITILTAAMPASATRQLPDKITYRGEVYIMESFPLEKYFTLFPEKKPRSEFVSTSLWRGYAAAYEIVSDSLYVTEIRIDLPGVADVKEPQNDMRKVFQTDGPVFAGWYTGLLVLPYGDETFERFFSTFSHYLVLKLAGGRVVSGHDFTREEYLRFMDKRLGEPYE